MKRAADVAYALHQTVVGYEYAWPHCLHQLIFGDQSAGVFQEIFQEVEGLRSEGDLAPFPVTHKPSGNIDDDAVDGECPGSPGIHPPPPTGGFPIYYSSFLQRLEW
nr:hypothetical protein [Mesorhizobium sp.]